MVSKQTLEKLRDLYGERSLDHYQSENQKAINEALEEFCSLLISKVDE